MNSVGPGALSPTHKTTTRPLPPQPPTLELVKASYNSLRIKWGDNRNTDMLKYSLQMEFLNPHNKNMEYVSFDYFIIYFFLLCSKSCFPFEVIILYG